jgi:flagellar biosynthetic protein FliO
MPTNGSPPLEWSGFIGTFCLVLVLLGFVLLLLRRGISAGASSPEPRIEVLETRVIGNRQRLVLVKVDGREALVGVTPQAISSLMSWESQLSTAVDPPQPGDAGEANGVGRLLARLGELRR